jgi:hypothetical protein
MLIDVESWWLVLVGIGVKLLLMIELRDGEERKITSACSLAASYTLLRPSKLTLPMTARKSTLQQQ